MSRSAAGIRDGSRSLRPSSATRGRSASARTGAPRRSPVLEVGAQGARRWRSSRTSRRRQRAALAGSERSAVPACAALVAGPQSISAPWIAWTTGRRRSSRRRASIRGHWPGRRRRSAHRPAPPRARPLAIRAPPAVGVGQVVADLLDVGRRVPAPGDVRRPHQGRQRRRRPAAVTGRATRPSGRSRMTSGKPAPQEASRRRSPAALGVAGVSGRRIPQAVAVQCLADDARGRSRRARPATAASGTTIDSASTRKCRRSAPRVSDMPNPSVPRVAKSLGTHWPDQVGQGVHVVRHGHDRARAGPRGAWSRRARSARRSGRTGCACPRPGRPCAARSTRSPTRRRRPRPTPRPACAWAFSAHGTATPEARIWALSGCSAVDGLQQVHARAAGRRRRGPRAAAA